jgi:hypothetical protein
MVGMLTERGRLSSLEIQVQAKDGTQKMCLFNAELVDIGSISYVLSLALDISSRKQSEMLAKRAQSLTRNLLNAMPGRVDLFNIDSETFAINLCVEFNGATHVSECSAESSPKSAVNSLLLSQRHWSPLHTLSRICS